MYLRYKRWQQLALHNVYTARANGRQYVFTKEAQGIADVPYKQDVEALLNPTDNIAPLEIATEKYGIAYDATGKEVPPAQHATPIKHAKAKPPKPAKSKRG